MTAKTKYENAQIILRVLENNLEDYKQKIFRLKQEYQKECKHLNTRGEFWEDYHKNDCGTSLYCKDCDAYVKEK